MIVKLIGATMVVFSSAFIGLNFAKLDKKRMLLLAEMRKALRILCSEIQFSYSPLPVAFSNIEKRVTAPISCFFTQLVALLNEKNTDSLSLLWNKTLDDCFSNTCFVKDDIDAFKSFGSTLGFLDKDMQISSIELVLNYIDNTISDLRLVCEKNSKLYQSLGLLGGLLIAILLI